jgi:hypothetical protein
MALAEVMPGTTSTGDAFSLQAGDLFAGAAKDHRIAGFQADDALARLGELHQHVVDVFLAAAYPATAFSHQHPFRLAAREFQHLVGDEIVEQDDVGRLQGTHRLQRQKFGVAGAGADKGDTALLGRGCDAAGIGEDCGFAARARFAAEGAVHETFPEGSSLRAGRQAVVDLFPERLRELRPSFQRGRQQGLDTTADRLRQDRRRAIG